MVFVTGSSSRATQAGGSLAIGREVVGAHARRAFVLVDAVSFSRWGVVLRSRQRNRGPMDTIVLFLGASRGRRGREGLVELPLVCGEAVLVEGEVHEVAWFV